MENLPERLKELDRRLVQALNERIRLHAEQKPSSEELSRQVRASAEIAEAANEGWFPPTAMRLLYQQIHGAIRQHSKPLQVVYLGPPATYTHAAAVQQFGSAATLVPLSTIADVFRDVEAGRAEYGVVPVENSTEGAVQHTLDMFVDSPVSIGAEIALRISHHLLSQASRVEDLDKLYSHPQGLAQCQQWLAAHLPTLPQHEISSTAAAADVCTREPRAAAVASEEAAAYYQLNILAAHIEDSRHNYTRFLVLSNAAAAPTGNDKTSLVCTTLDKPGALFHTLEPLARAALNMKKIESRPSKSTPWEYVFFIDLEGHQDEAPVRQVLDAMRERCSMLKVLGSYPQAAGLDAETREAS